MSQAIIEQEVLSMHFKRALALTLSSIIISQTVVSPCFSIEASASTYEKIKEAAEDAGSAAKKKTESAAEAAKKATEEAEKKAKKATEDAGNAAKKAADSASKTAKEASEKAGKATQEAANKAGKATQEAVDKAGNTAKEGTEKAKEKATQAGSAISEGANSAYKSASSAATSAGNAIKTYIANIDTKKFESGWDYAAQYTGTAIASLKGQKYVNTVQNSISTLQKNMVETVQTNRGIAQEAGFAAEQWATDTFNIDSALNNSDYKATRPASNKPNSADVVISNGTDSTDYSFKYYKSAEESAKEQAMTFWQDYNAYCAKTERKGGTPLSAEEYLAQYGKKMDALYESLYAGQGRIIPSDQLSAAKEYLNKRNNKLKTSESTTRQALSPSVQETLDNLSDRITAPDGTQSRPLTEDEAKAIVQLCRDGDFDPADFGIKPSQLITTRYILKQSIDAGAQSAIISTAFAIGPDVYKIIVDAAKNGKIDESKLKETGIEGVLAGSEGFVEGSVSSAIAIACQSGKFGANYVNVAPETVGTLTVLTIDAIRFGYQLSSGQITKEEYADLMTQDIIIALASQATGALVVALFPFIPFSYMAGSMAGAMLASVGYQASKEMYLELRGEDGFETFVPTTLASGADIAKDFIGTLKLDKSISSFKEMAVTAMNNGKIKISPKVG